jgi:hypothetical protein
MTIFFAGTEKDTIKGGAAVSTDSLFYDILYSRAAVQVTNSSPGGFTCKNEVIDDFWVGYTMSVSSSNTSLLSGTAIRFLDIHNETALIVEVNGGDAVATLYNSLGGTSTSTEFSWVGNNVITRYDFHLYNSPTNSIIDCYINDTLVASGSILGTHRPIKFVEIHGPSNNGDAYVSEVISADEDIIGWRVKTLPPIGDGSNIAWTGDYTNIAEVDDNFKVIGSNILGATETFLHDAISGKTGVRAVIIGAAITAGFPDVIHTILGSLHNGFVFPLSRGFDQNMSIFEINPATNLEYTAEELNAMEFGFVNSRL